MCRCGRGSAGGGGVNDMRAWQDPSDGVTLPSPDTLEVSIYTRPVLVIDPSNDEHIEAILVALEGVGWTVDREDDSAENLSHALRSLLAPPRTKPAEPDEHGAKVIDKGVQYVAAYRRDGRPGWWWCSDDMHTEARHWGQFSDDVEVLP